MLCGGCGLEWREIMSERRSVRVALGRSLRAHLVIFTSKYCIAVSEAIQIVENPLTLL